MIENILPTPQPFFAKPFQSGISDPRYPLLPPIQLKDNKQYDLYKGLVDKQKFAAIVRADVFCSNRAELKTLLKLITAYSYDAMEKKPSRNHMLPLELGKIPVSYRVTVTIGFGSTLFVDRTGFDRYNIRAYKPKFLKTMPSFPGDNFDPKNTCTDLIFIVASDEPYVNVAVSRYLAEYINKGFKKETGIDKKVFQVTSVETGFNRPDKREFLRFDDGIDNLRSGIDLERLVYVDEMDGEPDWCVGGSYMVYRKIREMMPVWEAFSVKEQEGMIGREKESGKPLSRESTGIDKLTPVYPDHKSAKDGPLSAHIRKVQPRREKPDLFGINDLDRRFLRRPYPFFDGVDEEGRSINGLHFVAYMKSIQQQFEHVTNMWQMNPDFPVQGTGRDALYEKGVLQTIDGGYYFCPPAPNHKEDFFGSIFFESDAIRKYKVPEYIYGYGITFIDIDETTFRTFAEVKVLNEKNELVRTLNNQEFNEYKLGKGEHFDFGEFKNADLFLKTSQPILPIIERIKKITHLITTRSNGSRLVFLTARSDFDDKEKFLNTFRKYGIDVDSDRVYVERSGNLKTGTVAEKKKEVVLKYLAGGDFRRVRLIDDDRNNLKEFSSIEGLLDKKLLDKIRKKHHLGPEDDPIEFTSYLVQKDGSLLIV